MPTRTEAPPRLMQTAGVLARRYVRRHAYVAHHLEDFKALALFAYAAHAEEWDRKVSLIAFLSPRAWHYFTRYRQSSCHAVRRLTQRVGDGRGVEAVDVDGEEARALAHEPRSSPEDCVTAAELVELVPGELARRLAAGGLRSDPSRVVDLVMAVDFGGEPVLAAGERYGLKKRYTLELLQRGREALEQIGKEVRACA